MISYETLKIEANERGCKVNELIALAPQNDPFYTGAPAELDKAKWFADLWQRFGFRQGVHLRRVHYRIVSEPTVPTMPNGLVFEALKEVDIDPERDYPLPEPDLPVSVNMLYDSARDYWQQLEYYQAHRHGNGHDLL